MGKAIAFGISLTFLALVACTPDPAEEAPTAAERAIAESRVLLPDDQLVAAVPDGFELDRVVRSDKQFRRDDWITVGVRLHPEEIFYARAIYYVLPDEKTASEMYERQASFAEAQLESLRARDPGAPRPFLLKGDAVPAACGVRGGALWWCHATAGRIYLVTQSSSTDQGRGFKVDPTTRHEASQLVTSFASVLEYAAARD